MSKKSSEIDLMGPLLSLAFVVLALGGGETHYEYPPQSQVQQSEQPAPEAGNPWKEPQ